MFNKKQKNLVYLSVLILSFFLFYSKSSFFQPVKSVFINLVSQPVRVLSYPIFELKKIIFYQRTFNEYKNLSKEVSSLKAKLVGMEEVSRENTRLQSLLRFKERFVFSSVVASVVARNPSYWNSAMIVDKGSGNGVKDGHAVVNEMGVVGKVVEVGKKTSKVVLLTDPQFSVAALVQRTRASGVVSGSLSGLCRLRFIDENNDIQIGDKVVTSKLSSSFPDGLLIGEVIGIREYSNRKTIECMIKPAVSLSQLEEILIIIKQ